MVIVTVLYGQWNASLTYAGFIIQLTLMQLLLIYNNHQRYLHGLHYYSKCLMNLEMSWSPKEAPL